MTIARCPIASLIALIVCVLSSGVIAADQSAPALRRPVALALSQDESLLYVANRDSGSVTLIDAAKDTVRAEVKFGGRVSDLARVGDGHFLLTDEAGHRLLMLKAAGNELSVCAQRQVSPYPVAVTASKDGRRAFVSALWTRQLNIVEVEPGKSLKLARKIDLPFAPRQLLLVEDDRTLVVADNFGGRLGIVDTQKGTVKTVREFYAHNIRGLAIDPASNLMAVSHSMLNEYAHTVRNDVHWGVLMSNDLRWLQLHEVLDPAGDFYNKGHMHPLGEPNMGGADPGELAFLDDGTVVVAMSGVDKVAFGKEGDFGLHRLDVGRRPTAVAVSNKHRRAYVANMFDDSISVIDLKTKRVVAEVSLGKQPELTPAQRGEVLFHSGRLSHDGWMTCHSCHTGGHTNGGLNDNFSDKSFGAPKLVLTLRGAKDTAPFAWNGETDSIEAQITKSSHNTMQGRIDAEDVAALAAFVRTLDAAPSLDTLRGTRNEKSIARGKATFHSLKCNRCHAPPLYTTAKTYDVDIHDKQGNTEFNPPSLRGVSQRGPFFHDSSAKNLRDVFEEHGHQLDDKSLSNKQLDDLLSFLRSL